MRVSYKLRDNAVAFDPAPLSYGTSWRHRDIHVPDVQRLLLGVKEAYICERTGIPMSEGNILCCREVCFMIDLVPWLSLRV